MSEAAAVQARPRPGAHAWAVWALGSLCFGYAFFQRVAPSVMVADLMREFAVGAAVLGNLSAIYFYAYAGLQIPIGALIDRWGARAMISASIALAGTGSLVFALSTSVHLAYLGRLMVGTGSAVAFVGTLTLISSWFPARRFAFLSGMTMLVAMAAGVGGQGPLAALVEVTGWRATMLGAAAFGLGLAAAIWLVVRNRPPGVAPRVAPGQPTARRSLLGDLRRALGNARVWNIAIVAAAMSGPMLAFGGLWGVPYFAERFGLERPQAGFTASLLFIGWALGAPAAGWLSDHLRRRRAPIVGGAGVALAALGVLFYVPGVPLWAAAMLTFAIGLASAAMVICFAVAREITDPAIHGATTGFVNAFTVGSGALLQPVIGVLLDAFWAGAMVEGARVYAVETYQIGFVSLMAAAAIGLIGALRVPETHCRPEGEEAHG